MFIALVGPTLSEIFRNSNICKVKEASRIHSNNYDMSVYIIKSGDLSKVNFSNILRYAVEVVEPIGVY